MDGFLNGLGLALVIIALFGGMALVDWVATKRGGSDD